MNTFTNILSSGLRRSYKVSQNMCKFLSIPRYENINSCILGQIAFKTCINSTTPISRTLTSGVCNFSIIKNLEFISLPQKRLFTPNLLLNLPLAQVEQRRSLIKFSRNKCKRKTVKAVIRRFYRLHWGAWIRTVAGKNKHVWKKSIKRRKRNKYHLFCNNSQSRLLNHMTTKFWKRRRYYVDDPYEPYHYRHGVYRGCRT